MKMLNKIIPFLILLVFISQCKLSNLIQASNDEVVTFIPNSVQKFEIIDNSIILDININGKNAAMMFDSRAPSVIFTTDNDIGIEAGDEITNFGNAITSDGKKIKNKIVSIDSAECALVKIENWVIREISWPLECDFRSGILGQDIFDIYNQKILINFDNNEFRVIESADILDDWFELKSKFKNGNITLFIDINGIEYPFGFDTGYNGSMYFKTGNKPDENINNLPDKNLLYGILYYTAAGAGIDTVINKIVPQIKISNDIFIDSTVIGITDKLSSSLVGMKFIQHFNFIIDYPNKAIYAQPRKTEIVPDKDLIGKFGAAVNVLQSRLSIIGMVKDGIAESNGLRIDDEILEINGINIFNQLDCDKQESFINALVINENNQIKFKRKGEVFEKLFYLRFPL